MRPVRESAKRDVTVPEISILAWRLSDGTAGATGDRVASSPEDAARWWPHYRREAWEASGIGSVPCSAGVHDGLTTSGHDELWLQWNRETFDVDLVLDAIEDDRAREALDISARFDAQLQGIVQKDTAYQIAVADRGGQMTSTLTGPAQEAAAKVQRKKDAALEALGREKFAIIAPEHQRLTAAALEAYLNAAECMSQLMAFEHGTAWFCERAGLQMPRRVADVDLPARARGFDARANQVSAPVVKRKALTPLAVPDFESLAQ
jgi:hypothetical protein